MSRAPSRRPCSAVVRNLTVINFVIAVGIVVYALEIRISVEQIMLLVYDAAFGGAGRLARDLHSGAALGARTLAKKGSC